MTKKLYEEALADVKKLKEVAEDNAKRALLEAVTPRIRYLIENQLLGEAGIDELEADPEKLLMDEFPESTSEEPLESAPMSMSPEAGKVTLDLDKLTTSDADEKEAAYELNTDDYELSVESVRQLGMLANPMTNNLVHKINNIQKQAKLFTAAGKFVSESKGFSSALSTLISEVEDTYSYLQTNLQDSPKKSSYETILENNYSALRQLMEQKMKKRLSTLSEADVTLRLTNMPDDLEVEDLGVEIITGDEEEGEGEDSESDDENLDLDLDSDSGEEGEEGDSDDLDLDLDSEDEDEDKEDKMESRRLSNNTIVEIDENMLRREIGRMKQLRETADMPSRAPKGSGVGNVAKGFKDDDLGDPFTEVELSEVDKMMDEDDLNQSMYEDDDAKDAKGPGDKEVATVESIKYRLAAEARLQTEAKQKASKAKSLKADQQKKAQRAKKMQEKQAAKKNAKKMDEAYVFYATKFNESVARSNKLQGMLTEAIRKGAVLNNTSSSSAAETGLRNKLAETNLFNAKLLFTNKLLQNESLTKRQKAEVIERLDEAKNEREVKLVYESLIKTLVGSSSQKLAESTNQSVIGSSSRPSRTASSTNTLNEGFESDRWARLAGIVK